MCLTAFDRDPVSGKLSNMREWAKPPGILFSPDGCCLDSEGGVWAANVFESDSSGRGQVVRVVEGGQVTHRVTKKKNTNNFSYRMFIFFFLVTISL